MDQVLFFVNSWKQDGEHDVYVKEVFDMESAIADSVIGAIFSWDLFVII